MTVKNQLRFVFVSLCLSSLIACGGGGGGTSEVSTPSINDDGILNENENENDNNPNLPELNTINNPGVLNISQVIDGNITQGKWQYFTVTSPTDIMLDISLYNLSGDVDLYVRQNESPTKFEYQCRSNLSNTQTEKCSERVQQVTTYNIGLLAREDSTYSLSATTEAIVYKKAMLLLHGLASSPATWNVKIMVSGL